MQRLMELSLLFLERHGHIVGLLCLCLKHPTVRSRTWKERDLPVQLKTEIFTSFSLSINIVCIMICGWPCLSLSAGQQCFSFQGVWSCRASLVGVDDKRRKIATMTLQLSGRPTIWPLVAATDTALPHNERFLLHLHLVCVGQLAVCSFIIEAKTTASATPSFQAAPQVVFSLGSLLGKSL